MSEEISEKPRRMPYFWVWEARLAIDSMVLGLRLTGPISCWQRGVENK
jgi:hypothetical protein